MPAEPADDQHVEALSARLRSLPSLTGHAPPWDADDEGARPSSPVVLFARWLQEAIDGGVEEPHAMTLSTIALDGVPDGRVLILKDLRPDGRWGFASTAGSAKGQQLHRSPVGALTFSWAAQLRSVRVRGAVERAPQAVADADFHQRGVGARAAALAGASRRALDRRATQAAVVAQQRRLLEQGLRADHDWAVWWLRADEVEFWQGSPDRQHQRLGYSRTEDGWVSGQLWS